MLFTTESFIYGVDEMIIHELVIVCFALIRKPITGQLSRLSAASFPVLAMAIQPVLSKIECIYSADSKTKHSNSPMNSSRSISIDHLGICINRKRRSVEIFIRLQISTVECTYSEDDTTKLIRSKYLRMSTIILSTSSIPRINRGSQ